MLLKSCVKPGWIIVSIALIAAVFVGVQVSRLPMSSERLRASVIETLSARLDSDVELASLTVRAFPRLHAEGAGLTIRRKGQGGYPPLISVKSFTMDGSVWATPARGSGGAGRTSISRSRPTITRITRNGIRVSA